MDKLIDDLGGNPAVAELTGVSANAVSNWRSRKSIPWRLRPLIADEAAKRGIELPDGFLGKAAA